MFRRLVLLALLSLSVAASAEEVPICYNYGCAILDIVDFSESELQQIAQLFVMVPDAALERGAIADAIGLFETFAGQQTPTWADKGGNANDGDAPGRMDCVDESANTTAYLRLLERRGWLHFHRVLAPVSRMHWVLYTHWSARIAEIGTGKEYAVDSWFHDNGEPAVIFEMEDWMERAGLYELQ